MAKINARIQVRRDTSTNWQTKNPVLAAGEIGYEIDTKKMKIGDGSTAWNDLPYAIGASGASRFVELADTPSEYTGQAGKLIKVNSTEDGLEFGDPPEPPPSSFKDLTDTPNDYTGYGGKIVAVKSTEDGLEFIDPPSSGASIFNFLDHDPFKGDPIGLLLITGSIFHKALRSNNVDTNKTYLVWHPARRAVTYKLVLRSFEPYSFSLSGGDYEKISLLGQSDTGCDPVLDPWDIVTFTFHIKVVAESSNPQGKLDIHPLHINFDLSGSTVVLTIELDNVYDIETYEDNTISSGAISTSVSIGTDFPTGSTFSSETYTASDWFQLAIQQRFLKDPVAVTVGSNTYNCNWEYRVFVNGSQLDLGQPFYSQYDLSSIMRASSTGSCYFFLRGIRAFAGEIDETKLADLFNNEKTWLLDRTISNVSQFGPLGTSENASLCDDFPSTEGA